MTETKRPLRVFLCHASGDKPAVRKLYDHLVKDGIDAWLDKEKLIPGQDWQIEIPKAVKNSDVVIVCLSSQSVTKEGFVQKEIKFALDAADEKPEGTIFIIPARLENCDVPERIGKFHWVDLFSDDGYDWLLRALQIRADSAGAIISPKKALAKTSNKAGVLPKEFENKREPIKPKVVTQKPRAASSKSVVKRILPETPIDQKINSQKTFLPMESDCYYFTHEYANSFWGKYMYLYQKKGVLRLTSTSLIFSSGTFSLDILLKNILSIETKVFSRVTKPISLAYVALTYLDNKKENIIGLVPGKATLPVWETNKHIKEWIENLEKTPGLSSKIIRPLLIPSQSESTRQAIIYFSVLAVFVIPIIVWLIQ